MTGKLLAAIVPPPPPDYTIKANAGQGCFITGDVPSLGCLAQIVMNLVSITMTFLGLVTMIFLLYGAIRFVTSSGDPKAIQSSQKTMTYAIIGAAIVLGSFILVNIVTTALNLPNPVVKFSIFQQP